jgi:glycosyltransferase involved in cell wall biosynthesis
MSTPLVSILIPTYNSSRYIERALASARGQTHRNIEIVLHDNASADDTWTIISRHAELDPRVKCYRNSTNVGPLRNWQKGLEQCRGEYVKILWSDDWLEPECVEACVGALESDPRAGLVFTGVITHGDDTDFAMYLYPRRRHFDIETYLLRTLADDNMPMSPGAALVRRRDAQFDTVSNADAELTAAGLNMGAGPDVLFLLRAAIKYASVAHMSKYFNHFQARADSFTGANGEAVAVAYRKTKALFLQHTAKGKFPRLPQKLFLWRQLRKLSRQQNVLATRLYHATGALSRIFKPSGAS